MQYQSTDFDPNLPYQLSTPYAVCSLFRLAYQKSKNSVKMKFFCKVQLHMIYIRPVLYCQDHKLLPKAVCNIEGVEKIFVGENVIVIIANVQCVSM